MNLIDISIYEVKCFKCNSKLGIELDYLNKILHVYRCHCGFSEAYEVNGYKEALEDIKESIDDLLNNL